MNAAVKPLRNPVEMALIERFEAAPGLRDAARPAREAAMARFAATGLPSRRQEPWHYTDLRTLLKEAPPLAAPAAVDVTDAPGQGATIAFSAGRVVGELPNAPGLAITALAADAEIATTSAPADEPLLALNRAFVGEGVDIRASGEADVLRLVFDDRAQAAAGTAAARVRLRVDAGATLTLVESHFSRDGLAHLTNVALHIELGAGAQLRHVRLNAAGAQATSLSTLTVDLAAEALFETMSLTTGARVSRHQVFLRFSGENAKAGVRGASLLRGAQHADTTLVLEHVSPHCESRETFKTIVDGEATGVFQGRIVVSPEAQKTDARMASNALLLSERATMNNKPELEIFADDVQCAHGATCGELDQNLLFYIMQRGLPRREAEGLLLQAFVADAFQAVENDDVREALLERARDWLAQRG